MSSQKPVIVTTSHRGVFFGYIKEEELRERTVTLEKARNVIYWDSELKGFLGLSEIGPTSDCKIGSIAGGPIVLHDVTSIAQCSKKAETAWKTLS